MLWILLVYVVASNGYSGAPALASSYRGATFATKEECVAAARQVVSFVSPGTDDVAKTGLVMVCAPTQPPPPEPPPPVEVIAPVPPPAPQPAFPPYPPPPKRPRH
ncbi:MAG: hypothetical protein WDN01_11820 [Rhizomicrobium sp.]